jgi:hypothetical protein
MSDYKITLTAKNEGVEYKDSGGVYRFNITRNGNTWLVHLPGSKGDEYQTHELSQTEAARIIPHVASYLENVKWFGLFGGPYRVEVIHD